MESDSLIPLMATSKTKPPGRKPHPEPKTQEAQLPIYGARSWTFDGLSVLPSPFSTGWPNGYVPEDIRLRMLAHPKVSQATNNLKSGIIGDGGRVLPAVTPTDPRFDLAEEIREACEFALRQMKGSWHGVARQMLDCVHQCHKVSAKAFRVQAGGKFRGFWMLDALQVLPNWTFWFLRDATGQVPMLRVRVLGNEGGGENDFSRERFAVLTFRPLDGSIWGTSAFAPAYEPYYKDVQLDPEEMANVAQYSRPTVVVIAPGADSNGVYPPDVPIFNLDGTPSVDELGNQKRLPVTEAIALKLQQYEAGSVLVLPGGSQFLLAEAQNSGDLISRVRESNERRIDSAIIGTHQLTEAKGQMSGNNAGVAQDVAALGITDGKRALEEMVENDIFTDIVRYNFGEAALDLLPIFDLGSAQNARQVGLMNAVAAYVSNGAFDKSQWFEYCAQVGLPLPHPDAKPVVEASAARGSGGAHGNTAPPSGASNAQTDVPPSPEESSG